MNLNDLTPACWTHLEFLSKLEAVVQHSVNYANTCWELRWYLKLSAYQNSYRADSGIVGYTVSFYICVKIVIVSFSDFETLKRLKYFSKPNLVVGQVRLIIITIILYFLQMSPFHLSVSMYPNSNQKVLFQYYWTAAFRNSFRRGRHTGLKRNLSKYSRLTS